MDQAHTQERVGKLVYSLLMREDPSKQQIAIRFWGSDM